MGLGYKGNIHAPEFPKDLEWINTNQSLKIMLQSAPSLNIIITNLVILSFLYLTMRIPYVILARTRKL
jgi:hypothetical protein